MNQITSSNGNIPAFRASIITDWKENRRHYEQAVRWIPQSEFAYQKGLFEVTASVFWKIMHPIKTFRMLRIRSWLSEDTRRDLNERFLEFRDTDHELAHLNAEQRKAVLIQEDRTLVIAGAGTGKTHTMVAKAHDTVRKGIAQAEEMAFVTFTRAAADEIRQRCSEIKGIEIGTIHHLARQVIFLADGKRPRLSPLADDKNKLDRLSRLEEWLIEAVQEDSSLLVDIHARRAAAERHRSPTVTAPPFVSVPPGRVRVRSWGEAQIALTFYLAGIPYEYEEDFEVPHKFRSRSNARYCPDFFLPDDPQNAEATIWEGIWFEHFAQDQHKRLPSDWSPEERQKYTADREWKEKLHNSLNTRFVYTEYGDIERCRSDSLSFPNLILQRISALGRSSTALPTSAQVQDLIEKLKAEDAGVRHLRVTYEIDEWIRTCRQQLPDASMLNNTLKDRQLLQEGSALGRLATPVMKRYVAHLKETDTVDHEGTILQALQYLSDGDISSPWHVLLVDEYQDVNPAQAAFVHALWESANRVEPLKHPRLTAVGDDWQAIFAFQGGDVALIRDFEDPACRRQRFHERVALRQTYRFGNQLARSTRNFATRDPKSIDREVIGLSSRTPHATWPNSIVLASAELTEKGIKTCGTRGDNRTSAVVIVLRSIGVQQRHRDGSLSVLVLGRKNSDIDQTRSGVNGGIDRDRIRQECEKQGIEVEFSTVHRAKGREADYVIFIDTGPSKAAESGREKALARALTPLRYGGANVGEERRIWYVALTRARHKVYVISDTGSELSPFFDELMRNEDGAYDIGTAELSEFLQPVVPPVPCPKCVKSSEVFESPALLVLRNGQYGPFASCNSYAAGKEHYCGYKERTCEVCDSGLMARDANGRAVCSNPNCGNVVPLCCCSPPKPMLLRRNNTTNEPFWGCQSFGTEGSCQKTRSFNERTVARSPSALRRVRPVRTRR